MSVAIDKLIKYLFIQFILIVFIFNVFARPNKPNTIVGLKSKQSVDTVSNEDKLLKKAAPLTDIKLDSAVFSVLFSPHNKFLITADENGGIKLWSIRTRYKLDSVLQGHTKKIFSLALSKDGRYLASAGKDQTIKIWNLDNKKLIKTIRDYKGTITSLDFSPDNTILASASLENVIEFWAAKNMAFYHVTTLEASDASIYSLSFHPENFYLAFTGKDKLIHIMPLGIKDDKKILDPHTHIVLDVNFSPKGNFLASGGADNVANLWKIGFRGNKLKVDKNPTFSYIHEGWVVKVGFSPDEKFFLTASQYGKLRIWDVDTMKLVKIIEVFSEDRPILDFTFSADGKYIAVAGKGEVVVYKWSKLSSHNTRYSSVANPRLKNSQEDMFPPRQ